MAQAHTDKYDRVLSVFRFADDEKAKAVFSIMDVVIKKASAAIQRHSMEIGGKEHNKWIDDCYLIIGKANFYKHEYFAGLESFEYVAGTYKGDSRFDALNWTLITYIQKNNLVEAEVTKDYISGLLDFPKSLKGLFYQASAELYLKQKNYEKAIVELQKAISAVDNRYEKTRMTFILAQLYQRESSFKKANQYYSKVIQRAPPYEMAFNAKLGKARCFNVQSGKSTQIKKMLNTMLKDEKNKDYQDQIFYTLGLISLQEKDDVGAMQYFQKSVRASKTNSVQKGLSFLEMASLYFLKHEYPLASAYYDSTSSFINKDHPDFDFIMNRKDGLARLVQYIKTVKLEDSLQKVAKMTPDQVDALLDRVIAQKIADEKMKQDAKQAGQSNGSIVPQGLGNDNTSNNGAWYFYNPGTVGTGFQGFKKRWGNRKLEDNWRRSNKELSANLDPNIKDPNIKNITPGDTAGTSADTSGNIKVKNFKDKKEYLKNLPSDAKSLARSNRRIMNALYNLMNGFADQINDKQEATKYGELLIKRYPDFKNRLQAYYKLYLLFKELKNNERAEYYKSLILAQYPDSEFAKIVQDPDYLKNKKDNAGRVKKYYQNTYQYYLDGNFPEVIKRKFKADSLFPNNDLKAKFDYLKALSAAKILGVDTLERDLKLIVKQYPKDEVRIQADETLDFIKAMREKGIDFARKSSKPLYSYKPDTLHYYVLAVNDSLFDDLKLKAVVAEYNKKFYAGMSLQIENDKLNTHTPLFIVKAFKNADDASDYLYKIKNDEDIYPEEYQNVNFTHFIITPANFQKLKADGELDRYMLFFKINYPVVAQF